MPMKTFAGFCMMSCVQVYCLATVLRPSSQPSLAELAISMAQSMMSKISSFHSEVPNLGMEGRGAVRKVVDKGENCARRGEARAAAAGKGDIDCSKAQFILMIAEM